MWSSETRWLTEGGKQEGGDAGGEEMDSTKSRNRFVLLNYDKNVL